MGVGEGEADREEERVFGRKEGPQPVEQRRIRCLLGLVIFQMFGKDQLGRIGLAGANHFAALIGLPAQRPVQLP